MARRWTKKEEKEKREELKLLYIKENKSIGEISKILKIGESTVYDRMVRLGVESLRYKKAGFNNKRNDITIPNKYSDKLAEFIGILLGDGHITPTQVTVTLGTKEYEYVKYVAILMKDLFGVKAKILLLKNEHHVVYIGSMEIVNWLLSMGLTHNKVRDQVDIPKWIFSRKSYMKNALRGLWDTDGSIYSLKFGVQMSFTNKSIPLLISVRKLLLNLNFDPSKVGTEKIYLTKRENLIKFFDEVGFNNLKHKVRFLKFTSK